MQLIKTFRNIIYTLVELCIAYGFIAVFIPMKLLSSNLKLFAVDISPFNHFGLGFIAFGVIINLKCYWDLIFTGLGTPDPLIPTEKLVVRGVYKYIRNPIYVGLFLILLGESIFLSSMVLLGYSFLWFLILSLIVIFIEEPSCHRRFGESYNDYIKSVPRWIPNLSSFRKESSRPC